MRPFALLLVLGALLTSCATHGFVYHEARVEVPARPAPSELDFHAVHLSGAFDVEIVIGRRASVQIQGDDGTISYSARRGVLRMEQRTPRRASARRARQKVVITTPYLDDLRVSGSNRVQVRRINAEVFQVRGTGASRLTLQGDVDLLDLRISGSSGIDARNLRAYTVEVHATGASGVSLGSPRYLKARSSGSSRISYTGNPRMDLQSSGASRVVRVR